MPELQRRARPFGWGVLICSIGGLMIAGCGKANVANTLLRKQNQELRRQIEQLQRAAAADRAAICAMQTTRPTTQELSQEKLDRLFTVHGLRIGRLTDATTDGLKVHVVPVDEEGQDLKAAGSVIIELSELPAGRATAPIGSWRFSLEEAREHWYGDGLLYAYVFRLPWQSIPHHHDLLVNVTFTDELTGRTFSAQRSVRYVPQQ